LDDLYEIFEEMDADGDDLLYPEELKTYLGSVGK